jgi:FecR protein
MIRNGIGGLAFSLALGAVAVLASGPAAADTSNAARFTVVEGPVVIQYPGGGQTQASVDALLSPGNYVTTGPHGRAEIQFNESTILRLSGGVEARLTGNGDYDRHVALADGTIEIAVLRDGEGLVEVDTPSATVRARSAGAVRISIGRDGTTYVTARRGRAEVVTPAQTYSVDPGSTLVASGAAAHPRVSYTPETADDAFDAFNTTRDGELESALSQTSSLPGYFATGGNSATSNGYANDEQTGFYSSTCSTAPLGTTYYGFGLGFSTGYGPSNGCASYGGWSTPFAWEWPYYYAPYWPIAYWPWYPIWYPYPPFPFPPPRHHHPLPPRRPLPPPHMRPPIVASVPIAPSAPHVVSHVVPMAVVRSAPVPRIDANVPVWRRAATGSPSDANVPVWRRFDAAPDHDGIPDASWDRFNKTRGDVAVPLASGVREGAVMSAPAHEAPMRGVPVMSAPAAGAPHGGPVMIGPVTGFSAGHAAPIMSAPHAPGPVAAPPAHAGGSASVPLGGGNRPPRR